MRVKNIQNTSSLRCKCTNWLDHWMRFTNKRIVPQCSAYNCASKSIVGGHVSNVPVRIKTGISSHYV